MSLVIDQFGQQTGDVIAYEYVSSAVTVLAVKNVKHDGAFLSMFCQ